MTIALSYLSDLSRVRVELSDLPDGTVQVQRAANASATDALWERGIVRGGTALPIESGVGQIDDFEFFADAANHYRAVPVDPPAGLLLPGDSGDYASTPDTAALRVTGDVVLIWDGILDDWTPASGQMLVTRWESPGNLSYRLFVNDAGFLVFSWSEDGSGSASFTSSAQPVPDENGALAVLVWLDVDDGAGGSDAIFRTAPTGTEDFTQLGDVQTAGGTTSIHPGTADLLVGAHTNGTSSNMSGRAFRAKVIDGNPEGTVVADVDFTKQTGAATSFTDDTGLLWTVNGNAEIVGIQTDSITPSLDGEVWLKSIRYPSVNRTVQLLDRDEDLSRASRSTVHPIVNRSAGSATHDRRLGRSFTLHIITTGPDHAAQAGDLDIILGAGGDFFIHVPANHAATGGYVAIDGETVESRLYRGSDDAPRIFSAQCTNETPPAPGVTGTLLTGETVLRLYGSGQALLSAHSTGRSLVQTMLDPDDLVVI